MDTHTDQNRDIPIIRLRPRFAVETQLKGEEVAKRIKIALSESRDCVGEAHSRYAYLRIPDRDAHYWSPQLSLSFDEDEFSDTTTVRGTYGPKPAVWTLFMFCYGAIGFAFLVVLMLGMSKLTMGESFGYFWVLPVLLVLFVGAYIIAYLGKAKGYDQGEVLHRFFEESTGLAY